MVLGIGVDVLDIRRLAPENLREDDPFIKRVFTPREIAQARASGDASDYYARCFSGKEAVFKAVKCSPDGVRGTDAEILTDGEGFPACTLHGALLRRAEAKGGTKMHVSICREGGMIAAFAVLEA
ncbi:MAG: holo-ACP synthase [Oscillospiraceae bacterium]|nr:holo-ACP synthase [Oscillospiraceae bacterium]